ncbi:MAG TPA: NADH-ubiquinone oxidoreductase-F iron-sulfur binding region domain-containing protein [Burkholderiaceae bacterium]|nr:NADH-ubiquinone oxidoreductase-F iron-sulfur binding region domain-containing protein [Burkholderiaceae bacterium]
MNLTALPAAPVVATIGADELRQRIKRKSRLKGRQSDDTSIAEVRALLGEHPANGWRRDRLIEHLHLLNDRYRGLHERHLVALAHETNVPMAEVFEVATFYHHFEVLHDGQAPAALTVRVCDGLSCEMAGAQALLARLPALLGADVNVIAAPCVGRCEQAPVAVVDQCPVPRADAPTVAEAVKRGLRVHPQATRGAPFDPVALAGRAISASPLSVAPSYCDHATYRAAGGYALAAEVIAGTRSGDALINTLEDSGLRGLGGAGFPAGRKWRIVREQPAPRLMAVNIDEGEPGTFKDRTYLERDPHRFLEGVLIAASVVGIDKVYIYLRDEYHGCRGLLAAELAVLQREATFPLPQIELRRGAGAYICGEESAMIQSIEGQRGEPRLRPPYIAQVGLFGRPTLEHNFETLYWARDIVQRGAAWFAGFGRHERKGLRSFSVSGRIKRPGVKLAPAGITLRELVDEYCGGMAAGHTLYAYLPGGASGGILPAALADIPLDFDTLQPHGCFIGSAAVIVLSQHDRARDAALNMMRFFNHESCGQCTPCRVGTDKAARLMEANAWDRATLEDLNVVMADASICGLGQAAPNPIRSVVKHFAHEIGGSA